MKKLILLIVNLFFGFLSAQTIYTSDFSGKGFTDCGHSGVTKYCSGKNTYFSGDVLKAGLNDNSINGNKVTFYLVKCGESKFKSTGRARLYEGSVCGNLKASKAINSGSLGTIATITLSHTSGYKDYYWVYENNSTGDKYYTKRIRIYAQTKQPDLIIRSINFPTPIKPGQIVENIVVKIKNQGSGDAGASRGRLYWSTSATANLSTSHRIGGYEDWNSISSGSTKTKYLTKTMPSNLPEGVVYFHYWADNSEWVDESNESNNIDYGFSEIKIEQSQPDLYVSSMKVPLNVVAGKNVSFTIRMRNKGSATSGKSRGRLYWSTKDNFSNLDVAHQIGGYESWSSLSSGNSQTKTFTKKLPDNLPEGKIYFYYWVDRSEWINEANEKNNVDFTSSTVIKEVFVSCPFPDCNASNNCGENKNEAFLASQYLCEQNIVQGATDGNLNPDNPIIREDLAKIIFKAVFGASANPDNYPAANFPNPYPDLQEQGTYETYHKYARILCYLEYKDGVSVFNRDFILFKPGNNIERKYVVKALLEAYNIPPATSWSSSDFTDINDAEYEMRGYIKKAKDLGIVSSNSNFYPNRKCTRAEAFIMLKRMLKNLNKPSQSDLKKLSNYNMPVNFSVLNSLRKLTAADGNFNHYTKTSFKIADINQTLNFSHSYNSFYTDIPNKLNPIQPLGKAWTHSYNAQIFKDSNKGIERFIVKWPSGSIHYYNKSENRYITKGVYDTFNENGNEIIIKKKNLTEFKFKKLENSNDIWFLTEVLDKNNNSTKITYESGQATKRIDYVSAPSRRKLYFYYHSGTDLLERVKDPLSRSVYFEYNSNDMLSKFRDAKAQETLYTYGNDNNWLTKGLLTQIQLPKGNSIKNIYDSQRRLSASQINNEPKTIININNGGNYNYNSESFTSSKVTFPKKGGGTTTSNINKNSLGNITQVTSETMSFSASYPSSGINVMQPTNTNTNGIEINYEYDNKGNVIRIDKPYGIYEKFNYNTSNSLISHKDGRGNITTYSYDSNQNLIAITNALNNITAIDINSLGLITRVTNPSGITTDISYNSFGNISEVNKPEGISSSYKYDSSSRLLSATNNGLTTNYVYDANDNRTQITNPMSFVTKFKFDANDNLTKIINAKNKTTRFDYDDKDRLISESFGGFAKTYTYDANGELKQFIKSSGKSYNYKYDSKGRLQSNGYVTDMDYDDRNNIISVSNDNGSISYEYDNLNRITQTTDIYGNTVKYRYDNNNNVTRITYPDGKRVYYTYDAIDRLTTVEDWNGNATNYSYLADNRLEKVAYPNGIETFYEYDSAGRLIRLSHVKNGNDIYYWQMTLDSRGNITSETKKEPYKSPNVLENTEYEYEYNDINRLTTDGSSNYSYDNDGNTTKQGNITMDYDINNKLTEVNSNDYNATYTYDALGNRRKAIRNGKTTKFVLDVLGLSRVLVETDENGTPKQYYVHGLSLISRVKPNEDTRYYLGDMRGSTIAMTDENGNVTHKYQYTDFGNITKKEEEDRNTYCYVGMQGLEYETENLTFIRARFYNPNIGRFLSEDPIWNTNLYPYADNNPLKFLDVNGKSTVQAVKQLYDVYGSYSNFNDGADLVHSENSTEFVDKVVDIGLSSLAGKVVLTACLAGTSGLGSSLCYIGAVIVEEKTPELKERIIDNIQQTKEEFLYEWNAWEDAFKLDPDNTSRKFLQNFY